MSSDDASRPADGTTRGEPGAEDGEGGVSAATVVDVLRVRAESHPGRLALVDPAGYRRAWTYRQLNERVERLAAGLFGRGVHHGDRVVVQLPGAIELFEVLFALLRIGAVPVVLPPAAPEPALRAVSGFTEAVACVVPDARDGADRRTAATHALARVPTPHEVYVVGDASGHTRLHDIVRAPLAVPPPLPEDLALLQYVDEVAGVPRLVPHSHADLLRSLRDRAALQGADKDTVRLAVQLGLPQAVLGLADWLAVLCAGGRVVLSPGSDPDTAFPVLAREGVTHLGLPPRLAEAWTHAAALTFYDLSGLRVLVVGGGVFDERAARRVRPALGCSLRQLFGTAEGLVSCTGPDDAPETVFTTQGRPVTADDEMLVVDDDGREVPPGTSGRLLSRGPSTIRGYWRAPDLDSRFFTADGFHRTGAIGRVTHDGHLVLEQETVERPAPVRRPVGSPVSRRTVRRIPARHGRPGRMNTPRSTGRHPEMPLGPTVPYFMPTPVMLPADRTDWALAAGRAALLILNVQNHLVRALERQASPVTELLANVDRLARGARAAGVPVIYAVQAVERRADGPRPGPEFGICGPLDSAEAAIVEQIEPQIGDTVLSTRKYSAFARTRLDGHLRDLKRDQVVIAGFSARTGVLMTAADAWTQDLEPFVVADAVADGSAGEHEMALEWVAATSGAVTTADRVAAVFAADSPAAEAV